MSDTPELPPAEEPAPKEEVAPVKDKLLKGVLGRLPTEIKEEMETAMLQSVMGARKMMIEKYGAQYPELEKLGKPSWHFYLKRHKERITKTNELKQLSITPPPEIMGVIDAITNPNISLEDKRNALTALFDSCQARSTLLEQRNANYIDAQLEALILANKKEQHAILKTVATLSDQLSKDANKDWLDEAVSLTQVILSTVYNTYKSVNQNHNFSAFAGALDENVTNVLKQYKVAKERLSKDGSL